MNSDSEGLQRVPQKSVFSTKCLLPPARLVALQTQEPLLYAVGLLSSCALLAPEALSPWGQRSEVRSGVTKEAKVQNPDAWLLSETPTSS